MKSIKHSVEINNFSVPNYVTVKAKPKSRQDGWHQPQSILLSELDDETLYELCKKFTEDVFSKAGKELVRFDKHGRVEIVVDGEVIAAQG